MLVATYKTKAALKAAIGTELRYEETSFFGTEYKPTGVLYVVGPGAYERKWYARVTVENDRITKVS